MESATATRELQVSEHGLHAEAGSCESLADRLADNSAPAVVGSSALASSAAVNAAHAQVTAAGIRCAFRVQAAAGKLAVASAGYGENEVSAAAQFQALDPGTVR
jgi:hypothetical protein